MFRLIAVTLAALYAILYVFGDETRRPDTVARAEPMRLAFAAPAFDLFNDSPDPVLLSGISEAEAVEMALAAGRAFRNEEPRTAPVNIASANNAEPVLIDAAAAAPEVSYWYVTGSRVNLRGGPGTSNPVVGQVTLGTEAEVLSDRDGWYEIRLADGSATGWISGKFLGQQRPG